MNTAIIVNPVSGAGKGRRMLPRVEKAVRRIFGDAQVMRSGEGEGVGALVRRAVADRVERLVVVGGDGTVNEAVNGFLSMEGQRPDVAFVFLPAGTGGDFARSTGAAGQSIDDVLAGSTGQVDAGEICFADGRRHFFVNIASLGVSAVIAHGVNERSKRLGGMPAFVAGTVRGLLSWRDVPVRLQIDDTVDQELVITSVAAANGRFLGSGMMLAPDALLNDGLLDVVVLQEMRLRDFVMNARRLYGGRVLSLPGATCYRGREITVTPLEGRLLLEADGEIPGEAPVRIRVLPGAIRILAPWHRVKTVI